MTYRAFDTVAKTLGYWQVTAYSAWNAPETYLLLHENHARELQRELIDQQFAVTIESPTQWKVRT